MEASTPVHQREQCANSSTHAADEPQQTPLQKLLIRPAVRNLLQSRTYPAFAALSDSLPSFARATRSNASVAEQAQVAPRDTNEPPQVSGMQRSTAADMIGGLHSVFEDLLLNQVAWRHVPKLAALLATLARIAGARDWQVRVTASLC
jgi:hypothetical protein